MTQHLYLGSYGLFAQAVFQDIKGEGELRSSITCTDGREHPIKNDDQQRANNLRADIGPHDTVVYLLGNPSPHRIVDTLVFAIPSTTK